MSSKSYMQTKRIAALTVLIAFLSTGLAALPVMAAPCSVSNVAVNSTVNASASITPCVISAGGTVNIALSVDANPGVTLKAVVTQPDGNTYFAWYNFSSTSGALYQIYPISNASTKQSGGSVGKFIMGPGVTSSPSTSEVGVYKVVILDYNQTTLESHPIASLDFYVENGLIVIVTTNASSQNSAALRNQPFTINAALFYIANGAPVDTATMSATATVTSETNPAQTYTISLAKTGKVPPTGPQFTGSFTALCNDTGAWSVSVDAADGIGNYGINSTTAYVRPTTLDVTASVNGKRFERTQAVTVNAHVTEPNGMTVTSGTVKATLYPATSNVATSVTLNLAYDASTSNWTGTWNIPYNFNIGNYLFNVTAADSCVAPDTGTDNTASFQVVPAQIALHLTAAPSSGARGTTFTFTATGVWPNGSAFTSTNFGTDTGYVTLYNNGTSTPGIPVIQLTYNAATAQWTGSATTYWNTTTGTYSFWAAAHDLVGNGGTSNSQDVTINPATLTITPWGEEVISGNSTKGVLYINFNVTYPSDLVSTASGNLGYLPFYSIPSHIDAYILYNGNIIRNGYNWYYNWSLSTKGTAVYTLYTVENAAEFKTWYAGNAATNRGVTNTAASGAVIGWPLGSGAPNATNLGNYSIEIAAFTDNATAPNSGHGFNSFPVAKVLTIQTKNVNQSTKESVDVTSYVYTAGTWTSPMVNPQLLPTSVVMHEWESSPTPHAHIYWIPLHKENATTGMYWGALPVDNASNINGTQPSPIAGMFAGTYWGNEVLTFGNKGFVKPTVLANNVAPLKVMGDIKFHLTRPYDTFNSTPIKYRPNVWYSINGTVTDNYGHPISGLKLNFIVKKLSENQSLTTIGNGAIVPSPDTGYVLIIPADAPTGNYSFNLTMKATSYYMAANLSRYFVVSKVVTMPALTVSASVSPSTIANGTSGLLTASVTSNGQPVSGATVTATVSLPTGATSTLTLLASSTAGVYIVPINIPSTGPSGLYTVSVNASKVNYVTGTGVTTFEVQTVVPVPPTIPALSLSLSLSPSSLSNGTSGVLSAAVTSNGQAISGADVTGTLTTPTGTSTLTFTMTAPGVYTATVSVPSTATPGTYTATVSASLTGYKSATSGLAFTVSTVIPPPTPKPTTVDLTGVYIIAGLAAIFALIALIYIAIKLK
jgi:hypothetical protein